MPIMIGYVEPPVEPSDDFEVTAGCGCNVFDGEFLFYV